jgi:ribosome maturation protein Sdo1
VEDSFGDNESDTMEILRDGQVKLGAARYEHHAGSQRQMVNQIRTNTVSHRMLLNVLKGRSVH